MSRRGRRRDRALGLVLPGLPQLLAGRWAAGFALATWMGFAALVVWRRDRVVDALSGPWDLRLAVVTAIAGLAGAWLWGTREAGRASGEGEVRWSPMVGTFLERRLAVAGMAALGAICLVALLAPLLAPFDPGAQGDLVRERFLAPSLDHPLGTDNLARDVLSRLLYGARISLTVGLLAVAISVTLGTGLGAVAGYLGGRTDAVIMRFVDVVISVPRLVLLITIVAVFEPGILVIVVVLGFTLWPSTARLVRGEVLSLREQEFIVAARALGLPRRRILARHIIPNALGPVIVAATLGMGNTIVLEAGLSFLGLGVQAPLASWGAMVDAGRANLLGAWWISTFPGLAIVGTVLAFNLVGEGLRDALDPRHPE
ncbi:MAG: ABC transporter permease [Gemmatimonadota bacterium]|jgi:peptide/nickel transport system permease protein